MKEIQKQIYHCQMQAKPCAAMNWIVGSMLLWVSAVALSAQSSTSLETEKIRIRKPVIPEIWYSMGSDEEPKAIGPTVQIRPISQRPGMELFPGGAQPLDLNTISTEKNTDSSDEGRTISKDSNPGNSETSGSPQPRLAGPLEEPFSIPAQKLVSNGEKPFIPTPDNQNGTTPSAASNPSVPGSSSASRQPVSGSRSTAGGAALGSSSSAGFGSSESSFEEESTSDADSKGSSAIDWSKNVQLNESMMVAVGDGVTLDIEGNVNLKKNQLRVGGEGNTDVTGKFVGLGTVQKSGSGVMSLYGKNSYNGDLVISEGTLLLGASNRLSEKIDVTLDGGSFSTGGFSENVGELTLTRDSIIDLGNGESILKFKDSSSSEWTSSEVVEVRNWSGAAGGGGSDQLYMGSSNRGLTENQLKQIEFFDPFGENSGRFPARILPSGEIVPAPEPSTILAALGALGWIGYREKRRLLDWFNKFRRTS